MRKFRSGEMTQPDDRHYDPNFPPELEAAPKEFEAWSQSQLAKEQQDSTPTVPLFHYTGEEALKGILANEKFWCFSHLHQSDAEEFAFSLRIARRVIKELAAKSRGLVHHFYSCLDDLLETNSLTGIFDFYLASFSRHRDDPGQWKIYGKEGKGYSIGLAPKLFVGDQLQLKANANENVLVGRVIYGESDTEARHRLVVETAAEITNRFAQENCELVKMIRPSLYLVTMAREVIAGQLVWNCVTAKENRFSDEREVRFIIMGISKKLDGLRKSLSGSKRMYIETPLPLKEPGSITEILVGPNAPGGAEVMIEQYLKSNGYPLGIPIVRSSQQI
jgi:hypothetical protein